MFDQRTNNGLRELRRSGKPSVAVIGKEKPGLTLLYQPYIMRCFHYISKRAAA